MRHYHYRVIIEYDRVDKAWITYVPALNWLSDFGDTREEALTNTREAIIGYLETLQQDGTPFPEGDPPRPFIPPWEIRKRITNGQETVELDIAA